MKPGLSVDEGKKTPGYFHCIKCGLEGHQHFIQQNGDLAVNHVVEQLRQCLKAVRALHRLRVIKTAIIRDVLANEAGIQKHLTNEGETSLVILVKFLRRFLGKNLKGKFD